VLRYTIIGRKLESVGIIRIKIADCIDFRRTSKCELLKLISEKFADPLLKGQALTAEYVIWKNRRHIRVRKVNIKYKELSTNLMIGLYAYLKAYQEQCKQ
jgi:hypothetical protein